MSAGAEGHTRIDGQHLPSAGISGFLPGGTDQQPLSYRQGLEVLFPAVGPVILLHLPVLQFMADALRCQPFPQIGRGFRRIVLRADVQMNQRPGAVAGQKFLINQVDMGNVPRPLFQIAVILDVNAVRHRHVGDSCCPVGILHGNFQAKLGPVWTAHGFVSFPMVYWFSAYISQQTI